jgi:hypothetical protein
MRAAQRGDIWGFRLMGVWMGWEVHVISDVNVCVGATVQIPCEPPKGETSGDSDLWGFGLDGRCMCKRLRRRHSTESMRVAQRGGIWGLRLMGVWMGWVVDWRIVGIRREGAICCR